MTDPLKIESGLTARQWAEDGSFIADNAFLRVQAPGLIAMSNAALPDDDQRKITWTKIDAMRSNARDAEADGMDGSVTLAFADALASYLPPREAETT